MRLVAGIIAACVLLVAGAAHAQLASPGDLTKAHASLEGLTKCSRCHTEGEQVGASLCLDCHGEIKGRIARGSGYHGHLSATERTRCEGCHHEHQGRDFALVDWGGPVEKFDHRKTGWALAGKHATERCEACHEPRRIVDGAVKKLPRKSWLGLATACTSCHFDEHRGQLAATASGGRCDKCHDESSWQKPRFDHQKTQFPLTGKHGGVACARCHPTESDDRSQGAFPPPRAATFLRFSPLEHERCNDCHEDPHDGKFTGTCASCHSTDGWLAVHIGAAQPKGFHDKTRYPLRGRHESVACASCHGPAPGRPARFKGLAFGKCTDCHADAHRGQLADPACERCHTVDGFLPARFELEQHQATRFRLEGAHAAVACSRCHPSSERAIERVPAPLPVEKGRKSKHAKRAPARPARAIAAAISTVKLRLPGPKDRCDTCHADPHAGQFAADVAGCAKCHRTDGFRNLVFDHDRDTRFALVGRHRTAPCARCHEREAAIRAVRYTPLGTRCSDCHTDPHVGQLGAACDRCHDAAGDFPHTRFSHDDKRFTDFALQGKHRGLACDQCHPTVAVAGGSRRVVRYAGVPRECEGCHVDEHQGAFRGFVP